MARVNHLEEYDFWGRVYCRYLDMRVAAIPDHFVEWCTSCPYFAGSNQGRGVECEYDEDHDPYAIPWRTLTEVDERLTKAFKALQQDYAPPNNPLYRRWLRLYPEGIKLDPTLRRFEKTMQREQLVTDPQRLLPKGEWSIAPDEARKLATLALAAALESKLGRKRARYVAENLDLTPHDLPAPHITVGKGVDPSVARTTEALLRCIPYSSGLREVKLQANDQPQWAVVYLPTTQSIYLGDKGERKGTLVEALLHGIGWAVFESLIWNGQRRLWQYLLSGPMQTDERAHEALGWVHDPFPHPENYRYAGAAFAYAWELYWQGHHLGEELGSQMARFAREAREFHPGRIYDPEHPLSLFREELRLSDFFDPHELSWNGLPSTLELSTRFLDYFRSAIVRERWGNGEVGQSKRRSLPAPQRAAMNAALEALRTIGAAMEWSMSRFANAWQGDVASEYVYVEVPIINAIVLAATLEAFPESLAKRLLPRFFLRQLPPDDPILPRALTLVVEWSPRLLRALSEDKTVAYPVRMVYVLGSYDEGAALPSLYEHPHVVAFYAVTPEQEVQDYRRLREQDLVRVKSEIIWNYGYRQDFDIE